MYLEVGLGLEDGDVDEAGVELAVDVELYGAVVGGRAGTARGNGIPLIRLAIRWLYWEPKSRMMISSWFMV